jgi:hypothetical protein
MTRNPHTRGGPRVEVRRDRRRRRLAVRTGLGIRSDLSTNNKKETQ